MSPENTQTIDPIPMPTARQVKAARVYLGLTQAEAAKAFDVAADTLADWERERRKPQNATVKAVGMALVSMGVRFDGENMILAP